MKDCRGLLQDSAGLIPAIERERQAVIDFIAGAYRDILANFDPKVLQFRKKRKVLVAGGRLR
jgi:hypothetical protein